MRSYQRIFSVGICCSALLLFSPSFSSSSADSPPMPVIQLNHSAVVNTPVVKSVRDTTEPVLVHPIHVSVPVSQTLFTLTQLQRLIRFQQQTGCYLVVPTRTGPSVYDLSRGRPRVRTLHPAGRSFRLISPPRTE